MDDPKNKMFSNMQWKQFEELFGSKFPFPANGSINDLSWVEQYVQDALRQSMPKSFEEIKSSPSSPIKFESFETVTHVIVKIVCPQKEKAKNIRIYSSVYQLQLEEGIGLQKQMIHLPAPIIPKYCKAVYKDGIFQLHLRKQQVESKFHEVNIRFLS